MTIGTWAILFVLLAEAPPLKKAVNPSDLERAIRSEGPAVVLERLWNDDQAWGTFAAGVSEAQPNWLRVAAALQEKADGGPAEEIIHALSRGFVRGPELVLRHTSSD